MPSPSALQSIIIISYCDYEDYRRCGMLGGCRLDLLLCLNFSRLFWFFFFSHIVQFRFWVLGCVSLAYFWGCFSFGKRVYFLFYVLVLVSGFPLSFLIHECIYTVGQEIGDAFYVLPSCHSGVCVFIGVCVRTLFICMYGCILSWAVIGCPLFFPPLNIYLIHYQLLFLIYINIYI